MNAISFIHDLTWHDLPGDVRHLARLCLLDTIGAGIGGRTTELSQIIHDFAASAFGGRGAFLWLDGRQLSPPGAALANGMTIDALDIHDGYTVVKGHAGAAVVPAVLASVGADGAISGQELLTSLVMGYEVALRAGYALHATACDYHTSGAWNALACAAVFARRLGLTAEQTRHALGIAEYHGPRSQMMRVIDAPTMLKDGSGWGAMAGVSAALMARAGFTGAPAITVEGDEVTGTWSDLGRRWLLADDCFYFKPYAICRWAQPAVAGALSLRKAHGFGPEEIETIRVTTFHEAVRLASRRPATTEEAQYSLPFPVAASLVHGRLGPAELSGAALDDPRVLALSDRLEMVEEPAYNAQFPAVRLARVQIETRDGALLDSGEVEAEWGPDDRPSDADLRDKFRWLAGTQLSARRTAELEEACWTCASLPDAGGLLNLLTAPPDTG